VADNELAPFVLASASPRRKDLLGEAGLRFFAVEPEVEELSPGALPPSDLAAENAFRKASAVALQHPENVVIGADTIVCLGDTVFGKPADAAHAKEMLQMLSGKTHAVLTAVSVIRSSPELRAFRFVEETEVTFRPLRSDEIDEYLSRVPVHDKAGAYAAQSPEGALIRSMRGCKNNVIGLPVTTLLALLKKEFPGLFAASSSDTL